MSLLDEFKKLNKVCQKPRYKEVGNWMVRNIIREACVPMTYFLLKTPITANQVTFFALLLGITGCVIFLITAKVSFLWLALFLHLSYYFDHVDGQIARCKNQVSLSGLIFDFISHYIIFGAICFSLSLKAYLETDSIFYLCCGIIAVLSIVSFNLLVDSKYRAFFIELIKHNRFKIKRHRSDKGNRDNAVATTAFSFLHKTCEMHVIINTITVVAILELFGLKGIATSVADIRWAQILTVYYTLASFSIAAIKISFVVTTRKPDSEFKDTFLVEKD